MSAIGVVTFRLSYTICFVNAEDMTLYVVSLVIYTMQWSIYVWWQGMADCIQTKIFKTLISFCAIWILVYWVSLMTSPGNAQTHEFSVVSLVKYTMNCMVYILWTFMATWNLVYTLWTFMAT